MAEYRAGLVTSLMWLTLCDALDPGLPSIPCPAPPPCNCSWNIVNCDSRNLSEIPRFNLSQNLSWQMNLSSNNIEYISSRAFMNLTGLYSLSIENNQIADMADDAFCGVEHSLEYLFMKNNEMKKIPNALGMLRNVGGISIEGNPVQYFQDEIFQNVSSTLWDLRFGDPRMSFWPDSLQYLTNLTRLTVIDLNMDCLPLTSFNGLEQSLNFIEFQRCEIQSLPLSMRSLHAFDVLSLTSNPNLNLTGDAFVGIQSLLQIYIRNQTFDTFPDIFHDALTVRDLDMSGTPITRFDASLIPENNKLRTISLSDTLLTEIPSAIFKMNQLQTLIIRNSSITSVSRSDFKGLRKLNFIAIQNAPLTSFSDDALNDTRNLQSLLLTNTNLTTIPKAIIGLSRINQLDMGGNPIVCTCPTLGWMKHWEHHGFLVLTGDCANLHNVTLYMYYQEHVPKCPEESITS